MSVNQLHTGLRQMFVEPERLVDDSFLSELKQSLAEHGMPDLLAAAITRHISDQWRGQRVELFDVLTMVKCQL